MYKVQICLNESFINNCEYVGIFLQVQDLWNLILFYPIGSLFMVCWRPKGLNATPSVSTMRWAVFWVFRGLFANSL